MVFVSEANRYSERPELSVRKLVPLLVCTSTIDADELPPAADDAEEAGVDGEPCVPLLQAVRTVAAARGPPTRIANEALLDAGRLIIAVPLLPGGCCVAAEVP
jgi:hypothetical protein